MTERPSARDDETLRDELVAAGVLRPGIVTRSRSLATLRLDDVGRFSAAKSIARGDGSDQAQFDVGALIRRLRRARRDCAPADGR
jgi:hypothetical protein